ncbi:hypothetical protein [Pseudaestuariivita sp.]|uniref:hypothetical protein n=1 Tax=Pseudaestuariivita sp. TaxID=2211669 RepID=UPI004058F156
MICLLVGVVKDLFGLFTHTTDAGRLNRQMSAIFCEKMCGAKTKATQITENVRNKSSYFSQIFWGAYVIQLRFTPVRWALPAGEADKTGSALPTLPARTHLRPH